jgi:hypothetical protein
MKTEALDRKVEVRVVVRLEGAPAIRVWDANHAESRFWIPRMISIVYATWTRWGPVWTLRAEEYVPTGKRAQAREGIQEPDLVEVPAWVTELVETHRPKTLEI